MSNDSSSQGSVVKQVQYTSGDASLFAIDQGAGTPLVFLHGGMADHRAGLVVVGQLVSSLRIIAPDVRGAGRSVFGGELSWDLLADDLACLMDRLGLERAVIGGISAGSAIALRFALRHSDRASGLVLVSPVYRGTALGLTQAQCDAMQTMDGFAQRALTNGIEALYPLYDALPEPIRDRAVAMASQFDVGSVAATTRFLASGVQPFDQLEDLAAIATPTLLIPGKDAEHPPEVAELYARYLPRCEVASSDQEPQSAIGRFCVDLPA